jgi:hypothetical protein
MKPLDFNPPTRPVPAATLRVGHVVMESHEHPAVITKVGNSRGRISIRARYIWSAHTEPDWPLGSFRPTQLLPKAIDRKRSTP